MSCKYCEKDTDTDLIHYTEKRGRECELWVYINNGKLILENDFYDAPPTVSTIINYCPMCGSKLGDSDD